MYQRFGKRLWDIVLSGCGIVLLWPVYLLLAVIIKLDDPGPVLFRQKRVGIHKTHFEILKFRTMKSSTPKARMCPPICWTIPSSISPGWDGCCGKPLWTSFPRSFRYLLGKCL